MLRRLTSRTKASVMKSSESIFSCIRTSVIFSGCSGRRSEEHTSELQSRFDLVLQQPLSLHDALPIYLRIRARGLPQLYADPGSLFAFPALSSGLLFDAAKVDLPDKGLRDEVERVDLLLHQNIRYFQRMLGK